MSSSQIKPKHPNYLRVFLMFAKNSLVRDMMFRANFLIEAVSSLSWAIMNIGFYWIIFEHTTSIGLHTGWGKYEFFVFMGTTWIINSIVQAFFMPNSEEFSELIRTGGLDFAMLKPIDTQFLISLRKVNWSSLSNLLLGSVLVAISLNHLIHRPENPWVFHPSILFLYPLYVLCGVAILYSLMICLAATSVWLGRNQTLYDFWFYITNFSRYPMEIYSRGTATIRHFHFCDSRTGCRQRARPIVSAAVDASRTVGMAAGWFCAVGHIGFGVIQPLGL